MDAAPDEGRGTPPGTDEASGTAAGQRAGSGRWVESSLDLSRGLTVHEGLPPDADLDEWLEAMLRS